MKKIFATLSLIALLWACSTLELAQPTQTDLAFAQEKFPEITLTELNEGKVMFEKNCGLCHRLKRSLKQDESEIKDFVPRMVKKVNRKKGENTITASQKVILEQYLITLNGTSY